MALDLFLTQEADRDLTEILRHSIASFGVERGERYLTSFESAFARIAQYPEIGEDVARLRDGYRRLVHERHAIFYRRDGNAIEVVRVLHLHMKAGLHL